ncbi:MAG: hypothetical protein ACI4LE_03430, partial [Faecalibacterium sp.]
RLRPAGPFELLRKNAQHRRYTRKFHLFCVFDKRKGSVFVKNSQTGCGFGKTDVQGAENEGILYFSGATKVKL